MYAPPSVQSQRLQKISLLKAQASLKSNHFELISHSRNIAMYPLALNTFGELSSNKQILLKVILLSAMEQVCTHQNLLMSSYTRFPAGQIDFQLNLGAIDMELESSFTLCLVYHQLGDYLTWCTYLGIKKRGISTQVTISCEIIFDVYQVSKPESTNPGNRRQLENVRCGEGDLDLFGHRYGH